MYAAGDSISQRETQWWQQVLGEIHLSPGGRSLAVDGDLALISLGDRGCKIARDGSDLFATMELAKSRCYLDILFVKGRPYLVTWVKRDLSKSRACFVELTDGRLRPVLEYVDTDADGRLDQVCDFLKKKRFLMTYHPMDGPDRVAPAALGR